MKISLIYYGRYQLKDSIEFEYLSAIAKNEGHQVRLACDPGVFGVTDNVFYNPLLAKLLSAKKQVINGVLNFNPEAAVFSVNAGSYKWACETAREIKAKSVIPVLFTGVYAALMPETIIKNDFVDYVICGESEGVFHQFLNMLSGTIGRRDVGNLWYKENGKVKNNPISEFVNPDTLPMPDKGLFKGYVNFNYSYMTSASKGCLYSCSYCEETAYKSTGKGSNFRIRSVDSVINELLVMKEKYGFKEVLFKDSFFTYDMAWLKEFLSLYKEKINVPFKCFGKIQYFNEETAELLKKSGCYCVEFCIQTWNQKIRKEVLNRNEENEQARQVFALCDKYALTYDIDHMFGLPGETLNDHITAALEYAKMKFLGRVKCHNLVCLPKMKILEFAGASACFGKDGDFFNTIADKDEMRLINSSFRKLFKV